MSVPEKGANSSNVSSQVQELLYAMIAVELGALGLKSVKL